MSDLVIYFAIYYAIETIPFGFAFAEAAEVAGAPNETLPAVGIVCGLLWPLAIAAAVLFGLGIGARYAARGACALARSFVALWRHLRGPSLPRAVARKARP